MPERKVLSFPGRAAGGGPAADGTGQLPLFHVVGEGRGKVAFMDVDLLSEPPLLRILAQNAVTSVVDLRPVPVFARPKFSHRHVVFYLHARDISYIEYAFIGVRTLREGREITAIQATEAFARIEPALARGLSLCLYDQAARDHGWVDEMRRILRHARGYLAELHPRSLSGNPR